MKEWRIVQQESIGESEAWHLVGDIRHAALLRGRGANFDLNKGKIRFNFFHSTSLSSLDIHWVQPFLFLFFPSSGFLLSSPIVFYKADIINQKTCFTLLTEVKGQRTIAGWLGKLDTSV